MTTKKIIRQNAKKNGVSPKQVESDMKEAIRIAMTSSDPRAKELWEELSPDGSQPTIAEFIEFCSAKL